MKSSIQITTNLRKENKEMNNIYDIWFSTVDLSNKRKVELMERLTCKEIYELTKNQMRELKFDEKIIDKILYAHKVDLDKYLNYLKKNNIKVISLKNKEYPKQLKNIDNKPVFLYVRGKLDNLYSDNIAIVGSRNASEYGKYVSRKIAKEISDKNINIVSRTSYRN